METSALYRFLRRAQCLQEGLEEVGNDGLLRELHRRNFARRPDVRTPISGGM